MQYRDIELYEREGEWFFEDGALAATHDAHGPNLQRRAEWMARTGAVECRAKRCLSTLSKTRYGRAHSCGAAYAGRNPNPLCVVTKEKREWFDHIEMFLIPARYEYVLTSQPYNVTLTEFRKMEAFAAEHSLELSISLADAWWYPGRTPLIVWQRRID